MSYKLPLGFNAEIQEEVRLWKSYSALAKLQPLREFLVSFCSYSNQWQLLGAGRVMMSQEVLRSAWGLFKMFFQEFKDGMGVGILWRRNHSLSTRCQPLIKV